MTLSGSAPFMENLVPSFGVGYSWRRILGLDYSFSPHPGLLSSHRVALHFTPAFPKFNGRDYREGRMGAAPRVPGAASGAATPKQTGPEVPRPAGESLEIAPESPAPAQQVQPPRSPSESKGPPSDRHEEVIEDEEE
jgi:hypothetical protein